MDIKNRLVLRLKLNKLVDCGLLGPIILHDAMVKKGHAAKLVQGWSGVGDKWGWHVWVTDKDNNILDVQADLTDWDQRRVQYTTLGEPEGVEKNNDLIREWDDYNKNPKKFWGDTDRRLKDFRAKFVHHS